MRVEAFAAAAALCYRRPLQEVSRMQDRVARVIERIRPAVQMDGGDIELVGIDNGVVKLRLVGACHGCPSSMMTLKAGIERAIRSEVPEITGVEAVE